MLFRSLDQNLRPLPAGVAGELFIGGDGLARGYRNRPELTAEKFISHPFKNGEKLYRTGDLARFMADGRVVHLGRLDHQVKLRGFRIELGEIESILDQHPAVQKNVVVARDAGRGGSDKILVGYVVPEPGQSPTVGELRRFLQAKLPDYMVPSAFMLMESLPLTPNGKVDRRALPAPDHERPQLESTFVAPRTPTEQKVAKIWTEVLSVERVGVHDNFFELGGYSLLAIQLISRIQKEFNIELPLQKLFEAPTVARVAEELGGEPIAEEKARRDPESIEQIGRASCRERV